MQSGKEQSVLGPRPLTASGTANSRSLRASNIRKLGYFGRSLPRKLGLSSNKGSLAATRGAHRGYERTLEEHEYCGTRGGMTRCTSSRLETLLMPLSGHVGSADPESRRADLVRSEATWIGATWNFVGGVVDGRNGCHCLPAPEKPHREVNERVGGLALVDGEFPASPVELEGTVAERATQVEPAWSFVVRYAGVKRVAERV